MEDMVGGLVEQLGHSTLSSLFQDAELFRSVTGNVTSAVLISTDALLFCGCEAIAEVISPYFMLLLHVEQLHGFVLAICWPAGASSFKRQA